MGGYVHQPARWNRQAAALWQGGLRDAAVQACLEALDADPDPDPDAFIQPGFYLFQLDRFEMATAVLERGLEKFPQQPMILLSLGSSYNRWGKHQLAIPLLNRFMALGHIDASAFDALASSNAALGDFTRARLMGTLALGEKDALTKSRHGTPALDPAGDVDKRRKIIAFTLFGSHPRYLRGALQNVVAARSLYSGWTCRFYADSSVDETFLKVVAEEGAEVVLDDSGNQDVRHRLTRRFLVSDDPEVGHFLVRDCDSVVGPREAAAVAKWLESGLPFHAMRDWYTHTDPLLAGLWGGVAGVYPDMAAAIAAFTESTPLNTNWDQYFLRDQVWPAVRDHIMVHDRYFSAHRAQPFPTPTPPGQEHVGQNEYAHDKAAQAAALAPFAERIPALALPRAVKLDLKLG
jgi:tetratricopeptide (TPR) repeat protein